MSSPTLSEQFAQLIEADPPFHSDTQIPSLQREQFLFLYHPLNDEEASNSSSNSTTPLLMSATPHHSQSNAPSPSSSVISNRSVCSANTKKTYDQIITSLTTLEKLLHIDFDLRDRQTAYNKKRQRKVFGQIRRKIRAICRILRSKEAALTTGQLSQIAHSVSVTRMKESSVHAEPTLREASRVVHGLLEQRDRNRLTVS